MTPPEQPDLKQLLYDAFEAGWFDNHGSIADAWAERSPEILARLRQPKTPFVDEKSGPVSCGNCSRRRVITALRPMCEECSITAGYGGFGPAEGGGS